jgi:hypothetical protein
MDSLWFAGVRLELAWTIRLDVSISSIGTNNLPRHLHRPESLANEFAWQHSKERTDGSRRCGLGHAAENFHLANLAHFTFLEMEPISCRELTHKIAANNSEGI